MKIQYDVFNAQLLGDAQFVGKYEMPLSTAQFHRPLSAIGFDRAPKINQVPNRWLHFYVHDIRFQKIQRQPKQYLSMLKSYAGVIGIDNSCYRDLPLYIQIANIGKNREFDLFLEKNEIPFIPNVSWGDWRSYEFCFDGIPHNATIAISSHGCIQKRTEKDYFLDGFYEAIERLTPQRVVFHGSIPKEARELMTKSNIEIVPIASRYQLLNQKEVDNGKR